MGKPAPFRTISAPPRTSIRVSIEPHRTVGGPHTALVSPIATTRADDTEPVRVLICVQSVCVRELIGLLLVDAGYTVATIDVLGGLDGDPTPEPESEVLILDAWPLRHADAAAQAHAQLAAQSA